MGRKKGAKNFTPFIDRNTVETTNAQDIRHLAKQPDETPLQQFQSIIKHQKNYLDWLSSRHTELQDAKAQLTQSARGPKDATYKKYKWYSEQATLLEAINGFEVFYKNTFIALAKSVRLFVPTSQIKGNVDSKVLWASVGGASFVSLIFEHQLYHDFEKIDEVSNMLVQSKRYTPSNRNSPLRPRVLALQAIFQIRHTISHNQGRFTQSDKAKLASFGYEANIGEIIDPSRNYLGRSIRELLLDEAESFTNWLLKACASYLLSRNTNEGIELPNSLKERIEKNVGTHPDIAQLPWV